MSANSPTLDSTRLLFRAFNLSTPCRHNAFVSCPVYKGKCVTPAAPGEYDAPRQVCIGNAGQSITPINSNPTVPWLEWQMADFGYTTINVHNSTHMSWSWFKDADNSLQHSFTIQRNFPRN